MNCDQVVKLLVSYLDKEVNPEERKAIKNHLSDCPTCREEMNSLNFTQKIFRQNLMKRIGETHASYSSLVNIKKQLGIYKESKFNFNTIKLKLKLFSSRLINILDRLVQVFAKRPLWQKALAIALIIAVIVGPLLAIPKTNPGNNSIYSLYTSVNLFNIEAAGVNGVAGVKDIYTLNIAADGKYNFVRITNNMSCYGTPVLSPDGSKIAFTSNRDSNGEIYIINYDGSNPIRLTNRAGNDESPVWSPNGKKIAFISRPNEGIEELYVMNSDGSGQRKLSKGFTVAGEPSWSPDSSKIAFMVKQGENWDIYRINTDGSHLTRLTDNPEYDGTPAWAPNDNKIAFISGRDGNWELYIMNSDGSKQTKLSSSEGFPCPPSWSPNSNEIAFICSQGVYSFGLYITNSDGSKLTKLTDLNKRGSIFDAPAWSRDGSKISFTYADILSSMYPRETIYYVINSDGTNLTQFTIVDSHGRIIT